MLPYFLISFVPQKHILFQPSPESHEYDQDQEDDDDVQNRSCMPGYDGKLEDGKKTTGKTTTIMRACKFGRVVDCFGTIGSTQLGHRSKVIRTFGDLLQTCWGPLSGLLGAYGSFFFLAFPHNNYNRTKMFGCLNRVFYESLQVQFSYEVSYEVSQEVSQFHRKVHRKVHRKCKFSISYEVSYEIRTSQETSYVILL